MSIASTIEFSTWKLWIIQVELPFSHSVALSSLSLSPEYGYKKDTTVMILNKRQLYLIYKYLTGYHKIICQNMVLLVVCVLYGLSLKSVELTIDIVILKLYYHSFIYALNYLLIFLNVSCICFGWLNIFIFTKLFTSLLNWSKLYIVLLKV